MRAGDLIEVDFGIPVGSEPGMKRYAIVLTADAVLEARPRTIHVVPTTGNLDRQLPTEFAIEGYGLEYRSAVQTHLCTVISTDRITDHFDSVGVSNLAQIRSMIADLLDLPI